MKINTLVIIKRKPWFREAFRVKYSVFPDVWEKALFFAVFSFVICLLHSVGFPVQQPILSSLIPTIVLGLLLVFRTNSANERFWEGRKLWGGIVNHLRNLTWQIWVNIKEETPDDQEHKINALNLLTVFAIATKNHLRSEGISEEMRPLLSAYYYHHLQTSQHLPLQIAAYLGEYLQQEYQKKHLNEYQLTNMQQLINQLMDMVGGCERILKTPIPNSYSIHLKQLLLIYCLVLPFQLVDQIEWWTIPFVSIVSYIVYGIEAIALEIENPFGRDRNDLPLDQICQAINQNIQDFILNQKR
ncbi:bestrophin family protein [Cyanobacterium sp. Dongsha4]|uniref:bestrophin family protein n=1 Tax=Cyanobacterium sp. DS4 TaxID=2878255 RepID=UPI002E8010E3|nr:bestrophin family ion channel [Cyanobacterium sp. Dongsha4]WVL01946.1 hypothetical protein Dongsha4_07105 [Cyanobacterium sp. Dongsha4]